MDWAVSKGGWMENEWFAKMASPNSSGQESPPSHVTSTWQLCPYSLSLLHSHPISRITERPLSLCRETSGLYPYQVWVLAGISQPPLPNTHTPSSRQGGQCLHKSPLQNSLWSWGKQKGCPCTFVASGRFYNLIREREWNHISFL